MHAAGVVHCRTPAVLPMKRYNYSVPPTRRYKHSRSVTSMGSMQRAGLCRRLPVHRRAASHCAERRVRGSASAQRPPGCARRRHWGSPTSVSPAQAKPCTQGAVLAQVLAARPHHARGQASSRQRLPRRVSSKRAVCGGCRRRRRCCYACSCSVARPVLQVLQLLLCLCVAMSREREHTQQGGTVW